MSEAAKAILTQHSSESGLEGRSIALADRFRSAAVAIQDRPSFREYKIVLGQALTQVLSELGYQATADDHQVLLSILRRIEPHPEVPAAFERLRERYRLAINSNTDDDLIAETA